MIWVRGISLFILILLPFCLARSQNSSVEGRIVEKKKNTPLAGVHVWLTNQADSTERYVTSTDTGGHFTFSTIRRGAYLLEASYLGYAKLKKPVEVTGAPVRLGTLVITESAIPMKEVVVEGRIPPAVQKGDTTEYTAAAFKMNRDATAEDLVTKMPGVTVESGTVKAQGEDVQQVLVDGRQFFGNDPTLALRNLPSEVIDKVQVFDKLSDQAQLTGFDDGQSIKTMNIVTRADRRRGQFGRFTGGYGSEGKYVSSGGLNFFQGDRRISLIGLSNNVNQQNFSMQDLLGVMGGGNQRGGFGGGGGGGGGMGGRGRRGGGGGGGAGGGRGGPGPRAGAASTTFWWGSRAGSRPRTPWG